MFQVKLHKLALNRTIHKDEHHMCSSEGRVCVCVRVCDLVDFFLFTGKREGEAQRKSLSLQILRDEEITETGCNVVEQLDGQTDTQTGRHRERQTDFSR